MAVNIEQNKVLLNCSYKISELIESFLRCTSSLSTISPSNVARLSAQISLSSSCLQSLSRHFCYSLVIRQGCQDDPQNLRFHLLLEKLIKIRLQHQLFVLCIALLHFLVWPSGSNSTIQCFLSSFYIDRKYQIKHRRVTKITP